MRVSEIRVNQIRVNQGLGVFHSPGMRNKPFPLILNGTFYQMHENQNFFGPNVLI